MRKIVIAILKAGTGQAIALFCAALSVKVLAVIAGPAGVGLFSLLRQIQQTLTAVASLGGQNAVVQGLASRGEDEQKKFMLSAFWCTALGVLFISGGLFVFAKPLAAFILPGQPFYLMQWLVAPVAAGTLFIFFRGVLNAKMQIGGVAWVNIASALGAVILVFPAGLAYKQGHQEYLILILAGSFVIGLLVAIGFASARGCLPEFWSKLYAKPDSSSAKAFLKLALPSLAVTFVGLGSVLLVSAVIVRNYGFSSAGHFDAAWAISSMYLTLFLSSLQTYLLPTISAGNKIDDLQKELNKALRLSAIFVVPMMVALIILKPLVVGLLYSGEFAEAIDILRWTLPGDYLRVSGWVFATMLLACADMRAYFIHEVFWNMMFVSLTLYLMRYGIEGCGPAYVIAYAVYLVSLLWRARYRYQIEISGSSVIYWLIGFVIVMVASSLTWFDKLVVWWKIALVLPAVAYGWRLMTENEKIHLRKIIKIGADN